MTEDIADDFWQRQGISCVNPREMPVGIDKARALIGFEPEYRTSDLMGFQMLQATRRHSWMISGQGFWLLRAADLSF
jgi:hypothetical protein